MCGLKPINPSVPVWRQCFCLRSKNLWRLVWRVLVNSNKKDLLWTMNRMNHWTKSHCVQTPSSGCTQITLQMNSNMPHTVADIIKCVILFYFPWSHKQSCLQLYRSSKKQLKLIHLLLSSQICGYLSTNTRVNTKVRNKVHFFQVFICRLTL